MLADDARVEELLRSGELPDIVPSGGSILAFARTPFAIDRLIALGAPTTLKDRWGSTPIDSISRLGPAAVALVRHLTDHGIEASPADYARLGDRDALARQSELDPAAARRDSVILAAVDGGHRALVEWLLQRGADVNACSGDESRHTPLHAAAWNGDLEIVKLLVASGADLAARDARHDATPLGWAETAIEVSNNPKCADVVAYLSALGR
jgi:ankyrin repeat protein